MDLDTRWNARLRSLESWSQIKQLHGFFNNALHFSNLEIQVVNSFSYISIHYNFETAIYKFAPISKLLTTRGLFLEISNTFGAHFRWHNSLCIFKGKASRGMNLCIYFNLYSHYNIWKDQLHRISQAEIYRWLFGFEKFSGLSRSGPQASMLHYACHLLKPKTLP